MVEAFPKNYLAILDVGHGNSSVLVTKEGNSAVIIDVGPAAALVLLIAFLENANIIDIEALYLSHADQDHIGAVIGLLSSQKVRIKKVFLNTDSSKGSQTWNDLLFELENQQKVGKIEVQVSLTSGIVNEYERVRLEVVAPSISLAGRGPGSTDLKGRKLSSNSGSAVIQILVDGESLVLLPGDLDEVGLTNLFESRSNVNSRILVFPHHGGNPGSDVSSYVHDIYSAIGPEVVVFSHGRKRFNNPKPEIVGALLRENSEIRILCTQLSVHCNPEVIKDAKPIANPYSLGIEEGICCFGTVLIDLDNREELVPGVKAHQSFISGCISTPLCSV